jgi:hypothetical protein
MDPEHFAERLRNKEIARTDQRGAEHAEFARLANSNTKIRQAVRPDFDQMFGVAQANIDAVNQNLRETLFILTRSAGGFAIQFGREVAGFTYVPPTFANVGLPAMVVNMQRQINNLAAFGLADPDDMHDQRLTFHPVWDERSGGILWRESGEEPLSKQQLIQHVMSLLDDRHA